MKSSQKSIPTENHSLASPKSRSTRRNAPYASSLHKLSDAQSKLISSKAGSETSFVHEPHEVIPLVIISRKIQSIFTLLLGKAARNVVFRGIYAIFCLLVLLGTTVFWAWLGAHLQVHNADQLSDPYMFTDWKTFHGASFPGAHTFLLKWPIFWLVGLYGVTSSSLLFATIGVSVLTVAILALILYKIDSRPLVFGTVCLALSIALLLIPAQPYAGGLLPANMAMLTTRNLEYALYLVALIFFARSKRIRNWNFLLAVLLLAILIASDKLFLSLSAGGALLALFAYVLAGNWRMATFAVRWMFGSLAAAAGALGILGAIAAVPLTNFVNSVSATPYGRIHGIKSLVLGVTYAVLGLFTNAGANPVYDNRVLAALPRELFNRLWSPYIIAYAVALVILVYALYLAAGVLRSGMKHMQMRARLAVANALAWMLIWSTVTALGVFVVTDHYFAVDARYLAIGFFTLAVCASVRLRQKQWQWPENLLIVAPAMLLFVGLAGVTSLHTNQEQTQALDTVNARNTLVNEALKQHKVNVLVGDYWRVLPIRQSSGGQQQVMPLADCTHPDAILTSSEWQPNLQKTRFAYLITLDSGGNLANFPHCTLQQITLAYGLPNATQIIAGTPSKPAEALLFYDRGSHPLDRPKRHQPQAPILPVPVSELPGTGCTQPTTMNIVAHEDDDLLFLSPDLLHDIQSGRCVRTVYLTAGDAGIGKFHWLNRQLGAEAAYSAMLGSNKVWDQQTVELAPSEYITVANLHGNSKVSLIFFNLPDGGLQGQGFESSGFENLAKLNEGDIEFLPTVDGQSSYSSQQLVDALSMLMNIYQPADIRTQADVPSNEYPDHIDHITTGHYALVASDQYSQQHFGGSVTIPVTRYIGYPVHGYDSNISGIDLAQKEAAFLAYAQYDGSVCQSLDQCAQTPTYGAYLSRQYQQR